MKISQEILKMLCSISEISQQELTEKRKMGRVKTAFKSKTQSFAFDNVDNIKQPINFLYLIKDDVLSKITNILNNEEKALFLFIVTIRIKIIFKK